MNSQYEDGPDLPTLEEYIAETAALRSRIEELKKALTKAKDRFAAIGQMHSVDDEEDVQLRRCIWEGQEGYEEIKRLYEAQVTEPKPQGEFETKSIIDHPYYNPRIPDDER